VNRLDFSDGVWSPCSTLKHTDAAQLEEHWDCVGVGVGVGGDARFGAFPAMRLGT